MVQFHPLNVLGRRLSYVQSTLAFERWSDYPQFEHDKCIGRVGLLACTLGTILGVNLMLCFQLVLMNVGVLSKDIFGNWLTDEVLQLALQWTVYVIVLCSFHLGEFFTTAVFNPSVTSADSFMVRIYILWIINPNSCLVVIRFLFIWTYTYIHIILAYLCSSGESFKSLHCSSIGK